MAPKAKAKNPNQFDMNEMTKMAMGKEKKRTFTTEVKFELTRKTIQGLWCDVAESLLEQLNEVGDCERHYGLDDLEDPVFEDFKQHLFALSFPVLMDILNDMTKYTTQADVLYRWNDILNQNYMDDVYELLRKHPVTKAYYSGVKSIKKQHLYQLFYSFAKKWDTLEVERNKMSRFNQVKRELSALIERAENLGIKINAKIVDAGASI